MKIEDLVVNRGEKSIIIELIENTNVDTFKTRWIQFVNICKDIEKDKKWDEYQLDNYNSIKRMYYTYCFVPDAIESVFETRNKGGKRKLKKVRELFYNQQYSLSLANKIVKLGAYLYNILYGNIYFDTEHEDKELFYDVINENDEPDFKRGNTDDEGIVETVDDDAFKQVGEKDILLILSCLTNKRKFIDCNDEISRIEEIVGKNDKFEVRKVLSVSDTKMKETIKHNRPRYLHFIGHSCKDGLSVRGTTEKEKCVNAESLGEMLNENLELLFLNSCESYYIISNVKTHFNFYGIGCNNSISDTFARYYSPIYYKILSKKGDHNVIFNETNETMEKEIKTNDQFVRMFAEKLAGPGQIIDSAKLKECREYMLCNLKIYHITYK